MRDSGSRGSPKRGSGNDPRPILSWQGLEPPSCNNVFKSCGNALFQAHMIGTGPREKKSERSFPLQKSLHSFGMIYFLSRGAYPRCASSAFSILTSFLLLFLRFLLSLVSMKHRAQALKRGDIFFKLRKNFRGRENNVFSSHATSAKQASSLNVRMGQFYRNC